MLRVDLQAASIDLSEGRQRPLFPPPRLADAPRTPPAAPATATRAALLTRLRETFRRIGLEPGAPVGNRQLRTLLLAEEQQIHARSKPERVEMQNVPGEKKGNFKCLKGSRGGARVTSRKVTGHQQTAVARGWRSSRGTAPLPFNSC